MDVVEVDKMFVIKCFSLRKAVLMVLLLIVCGILSSCVVEIFEIDGFETKEQLIETIKDNIIDLNKLTEDLYIKHKGYNKRFIVIKNKLFKDNQSYSYTTELSKNIFNRLRINYVAIYYDENRIEYNVRNKFGYDIGFYYSFDNDKNYETIIKENLQKTMSYIELDTKTAFLSQMKSGWYTEKICDNWYFFEKDFDNLYFIKYIYDDIANFATMSEYHQVYRNSFEKYNPHKSSQNIAHTK